MSEANFIISLDCEGKWGGADHLNDAGYSGFANLALIEVYQKLIAAFDRHQIAATFAFTSCFYLTPDEVRAHPRWFSPMRYRNKDWFSAFKADFENGIFDGWLCPEALGVVQAHGGHEIGSHGFCHIPLGDDDMAVDSFRRELNAMREAEALRGIRADTMVFPRNRTGHLAELSGFGFRGYRPMDPQDITPGVTGKFQRYLAQLNPREELLSHSRPADVIALPPGRMLLHRKGVRKWLPTNAVATKFKAMLNRAVSSGQVIHIFMHPHDFITGRGQFELLEVMLKAVADRARGGEIRVVTQQQYCAKLDKSGPDTSPSAFSEPGYA